MRKEMERERGRKKASESLRKVEKVRDGGGERNFLTRLEKGKRK
jgi:hypothetical protein